MDQQAQTKRYFDYNDIRVARLTDWSFCQSATISQMRVFDAFIYLFYLL